MRFKRMFLGVVAASGLALTSYAQASKGDADPYRNTQLPSERRAVDLLGRMTLDEKVAMLSGSGWMESTGIPRLGIPAIKMADGPMGIRIWTGSSAETSVEGMVLTFTSTAFPAGIDIVSVRFALGASMSGEESGVATPEARQRLKDEAVEVARSSDVAIVFVGYSWKLETEGKDRESMNLPAGQDDLIRAVAAVNKKTIVVFNSGGPVGISQWVNEVPGLIDAWFPGEEGGNAIADVLFGEVNPSGKLPFTFIKKLEDSPSYANYPGTNLQVKYAEGIYVGYRFFDKHPNVEPMFPFGYGLSYTSFALSELSVPKTMTINGNMSITATVRNTGNRRGATVVQLYLGNPNSKVDRPVRELKGFERVELGPGESRKVTFKLSKDSVSYYSVSEHAWVADPGQFTVSVGYSSRDLPLQGRFTLAKGPR